MTLEQQLNTVHQSPVRCHEGTALLREPSVLCYGRVQHVKRRDPLCRRANGAKLALASSDDYAEHIATTSVNNLEKSR